MKYLVRLMFLVFIPLIVGFALVLSGYSSGVYVLEIGVPGVLIILVIVGLVLQFKGKLFDNTPKDGDANTAESSGSNTDTDTDTSVVADVNELSETNVNTDTSELSEREQEQADIDKINDSRLYRSKMNLAEYEARHIAEGTKNASKAGVAIVLSVVVLTIIDVILATVFAIKQIWVGAIVCAALFGTLIVTALIVTAIRKAISMNGDISRAKKIIRGKVKSCFMTSSVIHRRISNPAVRLSNIVYMVIVCADDTEYKAYSKQFYEKDEEVVIAVMNKKSAKIVDESALETQSESTDNTATEDQSGTVKNHHFSTHSHHHHHRRH